jgi:flagellar hook assembly protein FlgD
VSGTETTGSHEIRWNGTNDAGGAAASGVYFCRLVTDEFNAVRKLVLIR